METITQPPFKRIKHILRELPFFEEFSDEEIDAFAHNLSLRSFPEQTCLFREGDIGDYLFFVVEGHVEVRIQSRKSSMVIARFGPGSTIGEMSLLDDHPRSATIITSEPSDLLLLSRQRLDSISSQSPHTGLKFLRGLTRTLSNRLRKANGRFADIA